MQTPHRAGTALGDPQHLGRTAGAVTARTRQGRDARVCDRISGDKGSSLAHYRQIAKAAKRPFAEGARRGDGLSSGSDVNSTQSTKRAESTEQSLASNSATQRAKARRGTPNLYRKQALEAHRAPKSIVALATPKPSSWAALVVLGSLFVILLGGAAIASIEVTVRAPGALRSAYGLSAVKSQQSGTVQEVLVSSGDEVAKGDVLARLEDAKLLANLELKRTELETLRREYRQSSKDDQLLLREANEALRQRRAVLGQRIQIKRDQLVQRRKRADSIDSLAEYGAASRTDALVVQESVQEVRDALTVLHSEKANIRLQIADRQRQWDEREVGRRTQLSRAEASVREAESLLKATEIRATGSGRVESLLARQGAVVQMGELIAQIVPRNAPRKIVAFLPSRETAFVKVGSLAKVEVESLPVNEFGMESARVTRISADVANPAELVATFGEATSGSYVRVELELVTTKEHEAMKSHLRSGERVIVRLHRRKRRILSLLFEFVRRWAGQ